MTCISPRHHQVQKTCIYYTHSRQFWDCGRWKSDSLWNFSIVGSHWTVNCLLGRFTPTSFIWESVLINCFPSRRFQSKSSSIEMKSNAPCALHFPAILFDSDYLGSTYCTCMGFSPNSLSVFWYKLRSDWLVPDLGWLRPCRRAGLWPPPSGPGSYPLALGHQLGMTFTKAPPKFSTYVIIVYLHNW